MKTYNHTTLANETLCFVVIYHVRRLVRINEHDVEGRLELGQRLRSGSNNDLYFIGEASRADVLLSDLCEVLCYLIKITGECLRTLAHLVDNSRVIIFPSAGSPRANQTVENLQKRVKPAVASLYNSGLPTLPRFRFPILASHRVFLQADSRIFPVP